MYQVSGTIGQPDAGPTTTNGQFSVTGGFWALQQVIQTVGAPTLTLAPARARLRDDFVGAGHTRVCVAREPKPGPSCVDQFTEWFG